MAKRRELPWQVFQLASSLLPYLDRIFEDVQLNPTDLFVLSHLKHYGADTEGGKKVMLKNEIRNLLKRIYGYSEARATGILRDLHNCGFVEIDDLTETERAAIFGVSSGYKSVIILQESGGNELENFNQHVNALFGRLVEDMPERAYAALTYALTAFATQAGKKLQRLNEQRTRVGEVPTVGNQP